jgi:hypothetical protein
VDLRTAQRWHAGRGKHHPPAPALAAGEAGNRAMLAWVASLPSAIQAKLSPAFRAEVTRMRIAIERGATPSAPTDQRGSASPSISSGPARDSIDSDWAEFQRTHASDGAAPRESTLLADLKLQAAVALFKLQRAQARGDTAAVKDATENLRYVSGVVHDEELRAQKLGREVGDILPRAEAARLLRALPYWLMRGVDDLLATLCPALARASSQPLYEEEIRAILEPHLLTTRVIEPFERASRINAGTTLPPWAIDEMRTAAATYIEGGATEFDRLRAQPLPPATLALTDGLGI